MAISHQHLSHNLLYLHLLTFITCTTSRVESWIPCNTNLSGSNIPSDFIVTNCTSESADDPSINEWHNLPHYTGSDFPINVTIYPYICYNRIGLSAWNTTFSILSKEVTGFIFRYQWDCAKYSLCRIYNFTNPKQMDLPAKFWFDASYATPDQEGKCMAVEVAVLPSYKWKKRFIFQIPNKKSIEEGHPLTAIDMSNGLMDNSITAYYTCPTSPKKREKDPPTFYTFLRDYTNHHSSQIVEVGSCSDNKTLSVVWDNLESKSRYSVAVLTGSSCQNDTDGCVENHSPNFILSLNGDEGSHWTIILIAISCALVMLVAIILVFKRKPPAFGVPGKQQRVLILYSHDTQLHSEAVEAFASYLKVRCGFNVILDKWDLQRQNPYDWLNKSILTADFVCIVWSQGAYRKATQPKVLLSNEPDYLGGDLFTSGLGIAKIQIFQEMGKFKVLKQLRFCHVRLPYVPQKLVASELRYMNTFKIPKQMDKLVTFLGSSKSPSCGLCFGFDDLSQNDIKMSAEGKALLGSVAKMQMFEAEKPEWFQEVLCKEKDVDEEMQSDDVKIKVKEDESDEGDDSDSSDDDYENERYNDDWAGEFPPRLDELPVFSVFGSDFEIDTKKDFNCKSDVERNHVGFS